MNRFENTPILFNEVYKLGYISCSVPTDITQCIETEIQKMIETDFRDCISYNSQLAGSIHNEYLLTQSVRCLDEFLKVVAPRYWDYFGNMNAYKDHRIQMNRTLSKEHGYPIKDLWINFQKKYEFNPIHSHSGDLSFVIWHKIPYDIEKEKSAANIGRTAVAGSFVFNYPDHLHRGGVSQHPIVVDKFRKDTIIIFDSRMQHLVYPFYTSDEYRISISGNLEII